MTLVLDCTLCEGGYYTNWEWDKGIVVPYLNKIGLLADYVEVGMRSPTCKKWLGAYAYTSDELLNDILTPVPERSENSAHLSPLLKNKLLAMVNASDFQSSTSQQLLDLIQTTFVPKKQSYLTGFRIAFREMDFEIAKNLMSALSRMGYIVFANIMGAKEVSYKFLEQVMSYTAQNSSVLAIYLADSFGNIQPVALEEKFKFLTEIKSELGSQVKFGYHAHDNSGLAYDCSKRVVPYVDFLDATVLGMGRGAGNLSLLDALRLTDNSVSRPAHISDLENLVADMKTKYKWGTNSTYMKAAELDIHPSYAQSLLAAGYEKDFNTSIFSSIVLANKNHYFDPEFLLYLIGNKACATIKP